MSKFGLPCAFLGKSDSYPFSTRKYIPFKENDVSNFSCSINVTVTSQNDVPSFHMNHSVYTASAVYT